jgi:HlyD family secretion protein
MSRTLNPSPATRAGTDKKNPSPEPAIFRKAALERLSTPEQLDYLLPITSPIGWLALTVCCVLLFLILLWGFLGLIPEKVSGKGILIRGGVVYDVAAATDGIIDDLLKKSGQVVQPGEIVARIRRPDLDLKIALTRRKLEDLTSQNADISSREDSNNSITLKALKDEQATRQKMIADLSQQEPPNQDRLRNQEELQAKGLATQSAVIDARQNLFTVQHQISENKVRLTEISSEELRLNRETQERRYDRQKEIDETFRQLREHESERDLTDKVICPYKGRVLEQLQERGNPVTAKDRLFTVETEQGQMQAVIYIPAEQGKKVRAAMEVQVAPSTVKPEEFGFILGKVENLSVFPSTPEGMQRVLRNERLVSELSKRGAPIAVTTILSESPDTPSGFKWSSPLGPPVGIFSGTLCSGSIVVARKHPVEYVIPKIKETLGL